MYFIILEVKVFLQISLGGLMVALYALPCIKRPLFVSPKGTIRLSLSPPLSTPPPLLRDKFWCIQRVWWPRSTLAD